jgi:hypothetical protein
MNLPAWQLQVSLVMCLNGPTITRGEVFQIDTSYPFVSINGQAIDWHSGAAAQWGFASLLVRIHPRGVVFKRQGWHIRDLPSLGWKTEHCTPSAHGLCQTRDSVIFPSAQPPEINEFLAEQCTSHDTQRSITNESRYDASSCDVLDRRIDYVYARDVVSYTDTAFPTWVYWSVCVLVVFLVRCLSQYMLSSLNPVKGKGGNNDSAAPTGPGGQDEHAVPPPAVPLLAAGLCVGLVLSQGDRAYVTEEELIFHWFTTFYVSSYACLFVGVKAFNKVSKAAVHDPPFYNLLAGVLQLVAARLYAGAETPYNPPLLFIVAVRALAKSRKEANFIRGVTLLLDACMLSLMCTLGFGPPSYYLTALFAAAGIWTDFLVWQDR